METKTHTTKFKNIIEYQEFDGNIIKKRCLICLEMQSIDCYAKSTSSFLTKKNNCKKCVLAKEQLKKSKRYKSKKDVSVVKNDSGIITYRECSECLKMLELSNFHKHNGKSSNAYLGIHSYCKQCAAEKYLKEKYGITIAQKLEMIESQDSKCKICQTKLPFNKLVIDHCHNTGKIRGMLCDECNKTLGFIKDNIQILHNMVFYLENSKTQIKIASAISDKYSKL